MLAWRLSGDANAKRHTAECLGYLAMKPESPELFNAARAIAKSSFKKEVDTPADKRAATFFALTDEGRIVYFDPMTVLAQADDTYTDYFASHLERQWTWLMNEGNEEWSKNWLEAIDKVKSTLAPEWK